MAQQRDLYNDNPLIHRDRCLGKSASEWVRSFACEDLKPLIVCRGPIRKEAMDVYEEMGITHYGILLSEKDSIVYPNALSPELRQLTDSRRVHRVRITSYNVCYTKLLRRTQALQFPMQFLG